MSALALLLAATLALLAVLHAHWAVGGLWPAPSEEELVRAVIGQPGRKRMPGRSLSLVVAGCLLGAAALSLVLRWPGPLPRGAVALAGLACAGVFVGRGAAGYVGRWRRAHSAEPFARLDRAVYSPLCFTLGAGFGILTTMHWRAL